MIDRSEFVALFILMTLCGFVGLIIYSSFGDADRFRNSITECEDAGGRLVYSIKLIERNKHTHYACMRKDLFVETK